MRPFTTDQAGTGANRFVVEVGPDLRLEHNEQGGTDCSQSTTHTGCIIDGRIEQTVDKRGGLTLRGLAAGHGGD